MCNSIIRTITGALPLGTYQIWTMLLERELLHQYLCRLYNKINKVLFNCLSFKNHHKDIGWSNKLYSASIYTCIQPGRVLTCSNSAVHCVIQ